MRVTLNLATKPWVDTATQVRRLRIALGSLLGVILICLIGLHFEAGQAQRAQQKRNAMDAQQAKLNNEKRAYEQELQKPQNQAILDRSQFLNGVFAEKSFSWTSVMMDLENVLPGGVQVASLDPQVMPDGSIVIRLRVRGDRDRAVDLVRNLERSKHFRSPRLAAEATEAQPGQGAAQPASFDASAPVAFEILADYNDAAPAPKPTSQKREMGHAKNSHSTKNPNPAAKLNPHPAKPTHGKPQPSKTGGH
jgi:type IV pilus assembly protein PilN